MLQVVDVPRPEPGAGEVRVKAKAIGVGMPDVLIRKGTYKWMPPLPAIPGNEMAGIVDAVGASQVLFGSDWPHPEGTVTPRAMLADLDELTDAERDLVLLANPAKLLQLQR